jgi:PTH1 family peptidyl-tRNA hydrolase
VGFLVVDALAGRWGASNARFEADAWVADALPGGQPVRLVKPLTFMNRSGAAVEPLVRSTHTAPADVLVVLDDVALELGTLRLRQLGSHGGHNGLRSVLEALGTDAVPRLRVGVRGGGDLPADLAGYVLAEFAQDEVLAVQEVVGRGADAAECAVREGVVAAMNRYNGAR